MSTTDLGARRSALLVFTLSSFLTPFMGASANVAMPSIGREFAVDAVVLSWIATSFLLAAAVFLVPFGRLADIYGRKKIFTIGISVYTLLSFLSGISTSATMLIVFRALQGVGSAMIFGTGIAILTTVFPANERGRVLGISTAAVYLGLSLGPFAGGLMIEHFGWRSIFLANLPVGLFILALVAWKLKGEWAEARGERLDYLGSGIYAVSLVSIMYGFTRLPGLLGWALLALGAVGMVVFVKWEMLTKSPVMNMDLFRKSRAFTFSSLAALINYAATFAVSFLLSLYAQYIKGLTPEQAGGLLVAQPIVMALSSPLAGRLSDRIEPRVVSSVGMGLVAVGLAMLVGIGMQTSVLYLVASLIVLGLGFGLFSSPNTNAIMSSVERRYYGVASGAVGTMRLTGQMLSMGIATLIFAVNIGRAQITPDVYPQFMKSLRIAFVVFACLCFLGVFASLARGNVRDNHSNERS
jgi:EmrB/QacA subfamily drug resistance transporter